MKCTIERFNPKDLDDTYEQELMEIETSLFEPDIQESWESKQDLIKGATVTLFAYDDNKIIGEAYTAIDGADDMGEEGHPDTIHLEEVFEKMKKENAVYFMSFAVLKDYQGQGIASALMQKMIDICKEEGFSAIYAHAHEGQSDHLFKKFGGQFIEKRENWFDTGETHNLYKIVL